MATFMINQTLSYCQDIAMLCKPLNNIGIDYFSYTRVYKDGARIYLSSEPKSIEYNLIRKNCVNSGNEMHPDNYRANQIIVWSALPNQQYYQDAALQIGANNGIYLFGVKNDAYCESFGVATSTHNETILNNYFNNLELLRRFSEYFKQEASEMINKVSQDKIILPFNTDQIINSCDADELDQILASNTRLPKLTKRQKDCAHLLMQGMSAKMIANELNISFRTVELYLRDMKYRLQCSNKTELIIKLTRLLNT